MTIDHTAAPATFARLIASLENLHRALDRMADNPGLREGAALVDAHRRLTRLAEELSDLTGQDLDHVLAYPYSPGTGELFLGAAELLATVRAAEWWHEQNGQSTTDDLEAASSAAYL